MKDFAKGYTPKKKPAAKKKTARVAQSNPNGQKKHPTQNKNSRQKMILLIIVAALFIILALFLMTGNGSKKPSNTIIEAPTHDTDKIISVDTASPNKAKFESIPLNATSAETTGKTTSVPEPLKAPQEEPQKILSPTKEAVQTSPESTSTKANEEENTPPKFTFYSNLTHETVPVDVTPQAIKTYKTTYMLQVGSYRSQSVANAARARLLLLGLKPAVSKQGDWYRLDVGPIYSKRDGDIIKHKLEANQISGSMLRQISKVEIKPEIAEKK